MLFIKPKHVNCLLVLDVGIAHSVYVAFFVVTTVSLHITFIVLPFEPTWYLVFLVWYVWIAFYGLWVRLFTKGERTRCYKRVGSVSWMSSRYFTRATFALLGLYGAGIRIMKFLQLPNISFCHTKAAQLWCNKNY